MDTVRIGRRGQIERQVLDKGLALLQAAAEAVDEALEALLALSAGRRLIALGQRRRDGQLVANEQSARASMPISLISLELAELGSEAVEAAEIGPLTVRTVVLAEEGEQGGLDHAGLGDALASRSAHCDPGVRQSSVR